MSKILILDDNATNRNLVAAILEHEGHAIFEAVDGVDGLAVARAEAPDLVISDILMPSMDGFEFVRQLRADPNLKQIAVIFYTAHYHEREARHLAQSCQVARVLVKPSNAAEILQSVRESLAGLAIGMADPVDVKFDRDHLRLITNKLSLQTDELRAAKARLEALTDLNLQLASERDPVVLLERVCRGARNLLGSKYAVLAVRDIANDDTVMFSTSGLGLGEKSPVCPRVISGALGTVVRERQSWRLSAGESTPIESGLPDDYPPAKAYLAVPVSSVAHVYGWLCLADKVGADGFSAEDEQVLSVLGAQLGRIYENGKLYRDIQGQTLQLRVEIENRDRALSELRKSEERFQRLAENIPDAFYVVSADYSQTLYVSPAYEQIWGRPCSDLYESPIAWAEAIHPDDQERIRSETRWDAGGSAVDSVFEFRIVRPDGAIRWILSRTFHIPGEHGIPARSIGVASDVTQRKEAEKRIEHLNRVYAMLSGVNSLIVRVTNRDELFKEACRLAVEDGRFKSAWCGWYEENGKVTPVAWAGDAPNLAQRVWAETESTSHTDTLFMTAARLQTPVICTDLGVIVTGVLDLQAMIKRGHRALVVLPLVIANKSVGSLTLATDELNFFDDEEMRLLTELAGDISFALDHIEKAEKLNYLAYYDAVTGLANPTFFHERLTQYLSTAQRSNSKLALIIADPQRFESINGIFGRHVGDQVLRQIAERFAICVGDTNAVGRISANLFAAVIENVRHADDVARTVEDWWRHWLGPPFVIDEQEVQISAAAGIALSPGDGSDATALLRNAEAALKNAKSTGKNQLFYTRGLSEGIAERRSLEIKLNHALEHEEFVLHYQPKVDLKARRLTGVEALLRWQSPEEGLVPPMKFIPVLEETGMIAQVGMWVLRQACIDRSRWLARRLDAPRVAVNLSMVQLRREDFVRTTSNILKMSGGEAGIDIEVTETLIMSDIADSIRKLEMLKDMGVRVAIDDFGTGYSSLAYLAKLPVEELKIDRSFVSSMLDDPSAMTLVSTIISLAHALKLEVVAEGVETEDQAKILHLLRCDQMQGFLISKPLSFDEMTAYMGKSRKELRDAPAQVSSINK
jgi:diguanylate cyclase (GGDEF)-like protein/PAS domain S-box-containing protein